MAKIDQYMTQMVQYMKQIDMAKIDQYMTQMDQYMKQ